MLFISVLVFAQQIPNRIVINNSNIKTAAVRLINKSPYITLPEAARIISYKVNGSTQMQSGNTIIKIAPGSFFVVIESSEKMKIAQMLQPVIIVDNTLYIPYLSFMTSLETLGLYSVSQTKKEILLTENTTATPTLKEDIPQHIMAEKKVEEKETTENNKPKEVKNSKVAETPQEPDDFFKAFAQTSKIMRKSLQYLNPDTTEKREVKPATSEQTPPNRYVIPKKLKRSALGEK